MDLCAYQNMDYDLLMDWANSGFAGVRRDEILPTLSCNMRRFKANCDAWREWADATAPVRTTDELVAQYPAADWAKWLLIDARCMRDVCTGLTERLKTSACSMLERLETDLTRKFLALGVSMEDKGFLPDGRWHLAFFLTE